MIALVSLRGVKVFAERLITHSGVRLLSLDSICEGLFQGGQFLVGSQSFGSLRLEIEAHLKLLLGEPLAKNHLDLATGRGAFRC